MKKNAKYILSCFILLIALGCKQGEVGPQGPQGDKGDIGKNGANSVSPGPTGDQGPKGNQGPAGDKGLAGANGQNGTGNLISSSWEKNIEWEYVKQLATGEYLYVGHIPFSVIDKAVLNKGVLNLQVRLTSSTANFILLTPGISWTLTRGNEKIKILENGFYEGYCVISAESNTKFANDSDLLTYPIEGRVVGLKGL